ncbi:50S ribosomal protein L30e-like protein [Echria macrotheca]|uniref:H/ACA ribonucleoprotein complex subunit 2 n=1 Tax=Echria macrotheca TaxID=438768 RepID=A0AAJ0FF53_9PEZI|nr:50S ribosomal protein L30e-like protein [Echria macrotheca]
MSGQNKSAVWPKAEKAALIRKILDCIKQAGHHEQLKKGAKEATESVSRGTSKFIILAADTQPLSLVLPLLLLAEEKNVSYVFLPSKIAIGRACGISRPVIAVSITSNGSYDIDRKIRALRNKVKCLGT